MSYLNWKEEKIKDHSPEVISAMYNNGFVFTRLDKGIMQQTRSVRIDLNKFELSSENRRILRKGEQISLKENLIPYSEYSWTIGKLAKDFYEEVDLRALKEKIDLKSFDSETLKKFLVDNGIGIDCSGFAYYVLNEENISRGKGTLDRQLSFPLCNGIIGKIKCKIRPIENTGVQTFAHDKNSNVINIKDIQVGDMITMVSGPDGGERDHILVIYQIEYQNFLPVTLHYVHAVAWPTDGEYGHGIHDGKIDLVDLNKKITEQRWIEIVKSENGEEVEKTGLENYTLVRAQKSVTEVRRLNWF